MDSPGPKCGLAAVLRYNWSVMPLDWRNCAVIDCAGLGQPERCLEHMTPGESDEFLSSLKPGADLDIRGTTLTYQSLFRLTLALENRIGQAWFQDCVFTGFVNLDVFANELDFTGAVFHKAVTIRVRAVSLILNSARFEDSANIEADARTYVDGTHFLAPALLTGAQLYSLIGTDVSNLTLGDVELVGTYFDGAHQLDKLRFDGRIAFGTTPRGLRVGLAWPPVWRWTSRRVLVEESTWRVSRRKRAGWQGSHRKTEPERIAALYRSLRKAFEDAKNEPGAGDFYYGEMEMRRHARSTPRAERMILTCYWAISGYGQRASRALLATTLLVGVLTFLLTGWGLPANAPSAPPGVAQEATLPADRWTGDRAGKATRIALGSVVFRDTDQKLTDAGAWTLMAGRALGPVLLALAVLAVRARVKR